MKKLFGASLLSLGLSAGTIVAQENVVTEVKGESKVVVVVASDESKSEGSANDKQEAAKQVTVQVIGASGDGSTEDILSSIEAKLADANISAEQKKEILGKLADAMKKAEGAKDKVKAGVAIAKESAVTVDGEGQVIIIERDGQQQKLNLRKLPKGPQLMWSEKSPDSKMEPGKAMSFSISMSGDTYTIGVQLTSDAESDEKELIVDEVFDETPAAKAGIKAGDVILAVNGSEGNLSSGDLIETIQKAGKEDKAVTLKVKRGDDQMDVEVKPAKSSVPSMTALSSADIRMNADGVPMTFFGGLSEEGNEFKFVPDSAKGFLLRSAGGSDDMATEMKNLKSELSEVKKSLEEIKSMLKEMKN